MAISDAEKRTAHTDALATLGTIIDKSAARDAIHLAVEPVVAGEVLHAGQHVGRRFDGTFGANGFRLGGSTPTLGIVDPFIVGPVAVGSRFWLVLYPRQITSLRHVWEHPSFPVKSPQDPDAYVVETPQRASSREWIKDFAAKIEESYYDYNEEGNRGMSYDSLMAYAADWLRTGETPCLGSESVYDQHDKFPEFWRHYSIVTGQDVPEDKREQFFRCAC